MHGFAGLIELMLNFVILDIVFSSQFILNGAILPLLSC